jgi:hypothetical protein
VLFLDEISASWGYMGDLYKPNFFARGERLSQSNYHQFMLRKAWKKRIDASVDYTWQYGTQTIREAALVNAPEMRVANQVRLEAYQRLNSLIFPGSQVVGGILISRGNGFAVTLDKHFGDRGRLEYGYADIDAGYGIYTPAPLAAVLSLSVNGDSYGEGKRYFVRPTVNLKPYLSLTGYYTQAYNTGISPQFNFVTLWNKQALNVGFNFDIKRALFGPPPVH